MGKEQDLSDAGLAELAGAVADRLSSQGWRLAAAESCTGGWIAKVATDLPGSSRWFERGFVTYSNEAKMELLGVREETLRRHGAVSEATVAEMATGALAHSRAQVALAVSGIAGPGGATAEKPLGMVCLGWARVGGEPTTVTRRFPGDREAVRRAAVAAALQGVLDAVGG